MQQRRSKGVLNGSGTHSVHQLSHKSGKASAQAAKASVQRSVLKACVQGGRTCSSNKFEVMAAADGAHYLDGSIGLRGLRHSQMSRHNSDGTRLRQQDRGHGADRAEPLKNSATSLRKERKTA